MNRFVVLLSVLLLASAQAAPPPVSAGEIDRLIAAMGASGCDFERNGRWYPAKQAEEHLRRKYEWLRRRDLVASAEQFIERAGTQSSMSGRAYRVRCRTAGRAVRGMAACAAARNAPATIEPALRPR
jgi:hypothetical protein